jgi:general stress protein 26
MATLRDLIHRIPVAMMTTVDEDGQLRSRPMLALQLEQDESVWFLTHRGSAKLEDIVRDPRVNLSFAGESGEYLSLTGRARVSDDADVVERLWNPTFRAWFPGGPKDPEIALVHVSADHGDYWKSPTSRAVRLLGMIKAVATGTPYEIERQTIDVKE